MTRSDSHFFGALGQRIAQLRKERGITQTDLAGAVDVSQPVLASYEIGRRRVPASLMPAIAKALGVSVEVLLNAPVRPAAKRGPVPKLQKQFQAIALLPKSEQQFFSAMIERFLADSKARAS